MLSRNYSHFIFLLCYLQHNCCVHGCEMDAQARSLHFKKRRRKEEEGKRKRQIPAKTLPFRKGFLGASPPSNFTYISLARIESHGYCKGIWEGILNWAYCCLEQNHSSVGKKEGGLWKLESLPKQCLSTHPGMMLAYTSEFLPTVFSVL